MITAQRDMQPVKYAATCLISGHTKRWDKLPVVRLNDQASTTVLHVKRLNSKLSDGSKYKPNRQFMVFSTEHNIYKDQAALSKLNSFGKK
jgi:hypothetical protein